MRIKLFHTYFFLFIVFFPLLGRNLEFDELSECECVREGFDAQSNFFNSYLENELLDSKLYLYQHLDYPVEYKVTAGINAKAYEGFLSFKKDGASAHRMTNFGFRLSPIFWERKNGKLVPVISFFAGSIKKPRIFLHFEKPEYTTVKPSYKKASFNLENILKLSFSEKNFSKGIQLNLPYFSFVFLKRHSGKITPPAVYLYASFNTDNFEKKKYKFNVSIFRSYAAGTLTKAALFNGVYGTQILFTNKVFSIEALGRFRRPHKKTFSIVYRTELDFFYKYAGVLAGFSGLFEEAALKKYKKNKERYTVFIRPVFHLGIFDLKFMYMYTADFEKNLKKSKYAFKHCGWVYSKVNSKIIEWNSMLLYLNEVYSAATGIRIKSCNNFVFFAISGKLDFQHINNTHFCLKKYAVDAGLKFCVIENFNMGISAAINKENLSKERKILYKTNFFWSYMIKKNNLLHNTVLNIKLKNYETWFSVSISYKIAN